MLIWLCHCCVQWCRHSWQKHNKQLNDCLSRHMLMPTVTALDIKQRHERKHPKPFTNLRKLLSISSACLELHRDKRQLHFKKKTGKTQSCKQCYYFVAWVDLICQSDSCVRYDEGQQLSPPFIAIPHPSDPKKVQSRHVKTLFLHSAL